MSEEPRELGASDDDGDLFGELRDFLDGEAQLLASLGSALDELVSASAARRLDGDDRAELWRRIEARVDPST